MTCTFDTPRVAKIPGFRLIECATRKLVTLSEIAEVEKLEFIALSYVWGSKDASDNPTENGLLTHTPKVIDDAIIATQCMGFGYLWVDRYCIPQNNSEVKHCQIRSMDIIYECATVTIIAAAGDDASWGLPGVASTHRTPHASIDIAFGTLTLLYNDVDYQLSRTRWDTRAWTFQEGLLSCRRLCFLEDQVYFQCNSIRCMESIWIPPNSTDALYRSSPLYMFDPSRNPIPFPEERVGVDPQDLPVLIDTYTERELSFQSDALNAFEGIFKRFASAARPVYHIWGIPVFTTGDCLANRLVAAFLWRLRFRSSILESPGHEKRLASYVGTMRRHLFPSWSWVDWDGRYLIKSGFQIQTKGVYSLVQRGFSALVELSMELNNGRRILYACEHGVWLPQNESHRCAKKEGTGLDRRVHIPTHPHGKWVPTLSGLEIRPPILRIVGYTCDAILRNISEFPFEDGDPIKSVLEVYRRAFRTTTSYSGSKITLFEDPIQAWRTKARKFPTWVWTDVAHTFVCTPLMGPCAPEGDDVEDDIEHDLCRVSDGLCHPLGDLPSSPLRTDYHFRVIMLGYTTRSAEFLVLPRSKEGNHPSETYQQVNTIQRVNLLPEFPDLSIPEALEAGLLKGWTMMETTVV